MEVRSASLQLCSKHRRAEEDPGKQRDVSAAMSDDRWCSPDPEAIFMTLRNNLLSALHSRIDGTARTEVVQPSHLLGVYLSNSSPYGALSLGILRLRSLCITILCFCLGLVLINVACLCSGQFLSTAGFSSQFTARTTG